MRVFALVLAAFTLVNPTARAQEDAPESGVLLDDLTAEQRARVLEIVIAIRAGRLDDARTSIGVLDRELGETSWLHPVLIELKKLTGAAEPSSSAEAESVASLYVSTTLYGLYTGAWLFGAILELDGRVGFPLSVLTAGAGVGVSYLLDTNLEISGAEADAISSGLVLGAVQGALLVPALGVDDPDDDLVTTTSWLLGIGSGALAGWVADGTGASRGDVALVSASYVWGGVLVLGTALTLGMEDGNSLTRSWVIGSTAGLAGGILAAPHVEWSTSRVLWTNLGGLLGALTGAAVLVAVESDDRRAIGATMTGSYAAGLLTAAYLTQPDDEPLAHLPWLDDVALNVSPQLIPSPDPTRATVPGMGLTMTW